MSEFKSVIVSHGGNGWGGPLVITPTDEKPYVMSVTLGGIHPVAQRIADLTGAEVCDQFKNPIDTSMAAIAVIDCAGVARCGTYPKMGIPTANVKPGSPSGPLAIFITEDIFASDVHAENIALADGSEVVVEATPAKVEGEVNKENVHAKIADARAENAAKQSNSFMDIVSKIGTGVGRFISIIYQAARDTVNDVIKNILPFMAFVSVLIGIINYTGFANVLANVLTPLAGSLPGMIAIGLFCSIPFLSPLICPGAIIASVLSVLIGNQIAAGTIPANFALPGFFAVNCQVGSDFAPVGMTLMEAKPETIEIGYPAFLFGKLVTSPVQIIFAYLMSFGL
ncbi:PTS sorbitol transporter subunit IIB [uncultured Olegusella sp.]|uniref:PTS sorbitol transporter subunit IIB n=1 Tax=uncultured Olegusella sp. TaxID=1979846 RepID=UPI00261B5F14|nr:PTS sorbitol transporter subunit IIB [uncultured Olegusella sp.]